MKIYHGYNRLENWLFDQAMSRDYGSQIAYSLGTSLPSKSSTSGRSIPPHDSAFADEVFLKTKKPSHPTDTVNVLGDDLVMLGAAMFLAPIPGPYDEAIGIGFMAVGGAMVLIPEFPGGLF